MPTLSGESARSEKTSGWWPKLNSGPSDTLHNPTWRSRRTGSSSSTACCCSPRLKDIMREHDAQSFTIQGCMRTVMPIAETTACLSLSLLQDQRYIAFCESDFASHPGGVLLRFVTARPVFMHNPTFPHKGVVTCAHCACPQRMDGVNYEPIEVVSHYESDYGAATKVKIPVGKELTNHQSRLCASAVARIQGQSRRQPFLLYLSLAARRQNPGGLEDARPRDERIPLDDGLRGLLERNGILHA